MKCELIVVIYCVQVCVLVLFCGASGQHDDDFGPPDTTDPVVAATEEILTTASPELDVTPTPPSLIFTTILPVPVCLLLL